jgi:cell division septum initiation protein DivIVA
MVGLSRTLRLRRQVAALSEQVHRLTKRVEELDAELLEARSQGRRIAEISDLVSELLVSEASRRDPEFQRIVAAYTRGQ